MKIQFGKIKKKDWDNSSDFIDSKSGKHYYYEVVTGHEDIHINDTCGRTIPIGKEHLSKLIDALLKVEVNGL